jgi:hypothetical protein
MNNLKKSFNSIFFDKVLCKILDSHYLKGDNKFHKMITFFIVTDLTRYCIFDYCAEALEKIHDA